MTGKDLKLAWLPGWWSTQAGAGTMPFLGPCLQLFSVPAVSSCFVHSTCLEPDHFRYTSEYCVLPPCHGHGYCCRRGLQGTPVIDFEAEFYFEKLQLLNTLIVLAHKKIVFSCSSEGNKSIIEALCLEITFLKINFSVMLEKF